MAVTAYQVLKNTSTMLPFKKENPCQFTSTNTSKSPNRKGVRC
uniref:Uncharacterized protein n=1 Tax=Arundo donax TaxID=35708 RepID=A0A0A8ZN41_ARUDO